MKTSGPALGLAVALCVGALGLGCQPERQAITAALPPGREGWLAWRAAHAEVAALRQQLQPPAAYTMNVTLALDQPQLGQRVRARGAVAVRPPDALRMILLGPGGTTALDLWICEDEFRFAIPAIDLLRRGDGTTPPAELRGLPVDFLRWWFLRPLAGQLLAFVDDPAAGRRYLLSDGDRVVALTRQRGEPLAGGATAPLLRVSRRSVYDEETLLIDGARCGEVQYAQRSTGIELEVHCEKVNVAPPPSRAFADPDDPSRGCGVVERAGAVPDAGRPPP